MSATTSAPDSVPHWTHPHTPHRLRGDDVEIVELVAGQRAESYLDGRTPDMIFKAEHEDAIDTMIFGTAGEVAVAAELGYNPLRVMDLETSRYGDDGSDVTLPNGAENRLDVKAYEGMPTGRPPRLLVQVDKFYKGDAADAYVLTQVWGDQLQHAVFHGWATHRDVTRYGRIEGPPRWDNTNWVVDVEDLRPPEELREWTDGPAF